MATIKLNGAQRDAIYGELVLDLSGTGDIRINLDGETPVGAGPATMTGFPRGRDYGANSLSTAASSAK